jgi:pimeloyl-ACP methyl ester carboxylesterase
MVRFGLLFLAGALLSLVPPASAGTAPPALGIALEGFDYPHPVAFLDLTLEGEDLRVAYMDVAPSAPANGRTVLLLHGRNFPSSYWEPVIKALTTSGYRVVAPDQIGFGKSSKPTFDYHFDVMARTTMTLLDSLGVQKADVVAHSMGGMLAVRLARAYPQRIERLLLEAPIGLEDYRFFVPPVEARQLIEHERELSADAYRHQLVTSYSLSLPAQAIEPFVELRERIKQSGEYPRWLRSFVNSYQMIYREPVVHEIALIGQPTLFIMGGNDHNAPGRALAPPELRPAMGHNAELAQALASRMRAARVEVIPGVGHLVHIEATQPFNDAMLHFLGEPDTAR